MWKVFDFQCTDCDIVFESMVKSEITTEPCPECQKDSEKVMSATAVVTLNDHSSLRRTLAKRSFDNSVKEAKKNPEKLAKAMGGTPKVQNAWNLRSQKK